MKGTNDMTMEAERKVKKDEFMAFRDGGVAMMNSLKLPWKASDDWDSMVKSADYALAHANMSGERGTAQAALAMWMHGYLECKTMEEVEKASGIIEADETAKKAMSGK